MAAIIADNIISPLGFTSEATYQAIKSGRSALCHYDGKEGLPFGFTASLFSDEQNEKIAVEGYTRFESMAIRSIQSAIAKVEIPLNERTILIVSTTKGNVELLTTQDDNPDNVTSVGQAALQIANAIGVTTQPIVACNACISGVSALILANRLIESGDCDYAIVCGVDSQNPFIISGFQSLKALSESECRPFDIERIGLNLGEAAATIVLGRVSAEKLQSWRILGGAVRNDAFHMTNPSPTGEGCRSAIEEALEEYDAEKLALVNAHGTATMFNDQMESKAISRANLSEVPMNALKCYFGHTMGAAGIMETILSIHSIDDDIILGTRGFEEIGVSGKVNISAENRATEKTGVLKLISGFGGCNGAILLDKQVDRQQDKAICHYEIKNRVHITPDCVAIDGQKLEVAEEELKLLTELYKECINDYPKFYKMDPLARLGFVATELLLQKEGGVRFEDTTSRAIVFFNSKASINADLEYLKTISDLDEFFPSPSLFVYTLPNIVTGEIAIRNKIHGETAFYILPAKDEMLMNRVIETSFSDSAIESVITGWLEYQDEDNFEADIFIVNKKIN